MNQLPYSLLAELEDVAGKGNPPVHMWHPDVEKDPDLTIQRNGTWLYMGTPIKRPRLVRLFASVLRREGDDYFLVTPVEKCRIQVEDVPFQVVLMDVEGAGETQRLRCTTDMAESFVIGQANPLRMSVSGEEWIPYALVRDGMEARLNRNVYYQLTELMTENATGEQGVWSDGVFFTLLR
ncbi:MAG: DUF1285 domain-containing protein [Pseudomonadales bacterium]